MASARGATAADLRLLTRSRLSLPPTNSLAPSLAAGAFAATMAEPDAGATISRAWRAAVAEPRAAFSVVGADDLVPEDLRPEHAAVRSAGFAGPWGGAVS